MWLFNNFTSIFFTLFLILLPASRYCQMIKHFQLIESTVLRLWSINGTLGNRLNLDAKGKQYSAVAGISCFGTERC